MNLFHLIRRLIYRGEAHHIYNCWHIRCPNGMLYYAIDYIRDDRTKNIVLCRNTKIALALSEAIDLDNSILITLSPVLYILFLLFLIVYSHIYSFQTFTPSCHPVPFLAKNTITVHDSYPFSQLTILSILRKYILYFSLLFSDCTIGYINKSSSFGFALLLRNISLRGMHNIRYLPNKKPEFNLSLYSQNAEIYPLKIGLCGSNSSKKNYSELINSLYKHKALVDQITFIVYGFQTPYIKSVIKSSQYKFVLLDSTLNSFEAFASNINVLTCVSFDEGYCRPIAALLQSNVPVLLLKTPALVEFYSSSSSIFFNTIHELSEDIIKRINSDLS